MGQQTADTIPAFILFFFDGLGIFIFFVRGSHGKITNRHLANRHLRIFDDATDDDADGDDDC